MIGHLKGKIISKNPPEVLLEVGGIGYEILCPMSTVYQLDKTSEDTLLFTHLSIKEDAHTLFGFITKDEKSIFRELIRVNGVGPKVALAILSHLSVNALIECISNEDADLLSKTPGMNFAGVGSATNPAKAFAAANFISSVIASFLASKAPRKIPGKTKTLFI